MSTPIERGGGEETLIDAQSLAIFVCACCFFATYGHDNLLPGTRMMHMMVYSVQLLRKRKLSHSLLSTFGSMCRPALIPPLGMRCSGDNPLMERNSAGCVFVRPPLGMRCSGDSPLMERNSAGCVFVRTFSVVVWQAVDERLLQHPSTPPLRNSTPGTDDDLQ